MTHFSIADEIGFDKPDTTVNIKKTFNIDMDGDVPAFSKKSQMVPEIDKAYVFDETTTKAILASMVHNRRLMIQGYHGTGKSSHIEQVCARLNYPCMRINLDSHISRIDLIGKDAIVIKDGKQITDFKEGVLPWALQNPVALVFDEYDAGRPDVMFVIQRILEENGKLTLLDQNKVLTPHENFRLFSTANTVGLGDTTGMYHGTQPINQAQMDRWNIVCTLNYLSREQELGIIKSKHKSALKDDVYKNMLAVADLTRQGFVNGDISTVMSPRTVLAWVENTAIFDGDIDYSFRVSFLNKCDESERAIIAEYYQRCFGNDIKI